jgi:hypothetical protein
LRKQKGMPPPVKYKKEYLLLISWVNKVVSGEW